VLAWPVKKRMGEKKGGTTAIGDTLYNGMVEGGGGVRRGLGRGPT
jgi:hypothetical protein